jgi:hypothetical protein
MDLDNIPTPGAAAYTSPDTDEDGQHTAEAEAGAANE